MAQYINLKNVEAIQWFKNGDHPRDKVGEQVVDWGKVAELRPDLLNQDKGIETKDIPEEAYYTKIEGCVVRFFRLPPPGPNGTDICHLCGSDWHDHGWIDDCNDGVPVDGLIVCPGDWVITDKIHGGYEVIKPNVFEANIPRWL